MASDWLYAVSFFGALGLSLVLVPLVRMVALRRAIVDLPGGHKSHTSPVPYLGGTAMVVAFSAAVLVGTFLRRNTTIGDGDLPVIVGSDGFFGRGVGAVGELVLVLGLALVLATMGLIDDLRGLNPSLRLVIEGAVASVVILVGVQFDSPLPDGFDAVVTLVWIVGITNALNLLDNIDGLAAGVTAVAGTAIFVIALMYDQPLTAVLAIGLAGCSLGFLRSNFNPATIYMGDSGSLYLGFLLSYLALKLRVNPKETTQLFVPIVVLGVAVMDTALVVVSRLRRGVHPFEGGKDHISHRVVRLGISVRRGVTVILLSAAVLGALGIALSQMPERYGWWVLGAAGVHAAGLVVLLTTKSALAAADQVPGTVSLFRRKSAG